MPQKSNHDFKEKYPYIRAGKLEPLRITDILTKKTDFFASVLTELLIFHYTL